jgi:hypothetical protein
MAYARHIGHIKKFVDTIRAYKKNTDFLSLQDGLEMLNLRETYGLHLASSTLIGSEKNAVQCISVHKAK